MLHEREKEAGAPAFPFQRPHSFGCYTNEKKKVLYYCESRIAITMPPLSEQVSMPLISDDTNHQLLRSKEGNTGIANEVQVEQERSQEFDLIVFSFSDGREEVPLQKQQAPLRDQTTFTTAPPILDLLDVLPLEEEKEDADKEEETNAFDDSVVQEAIDMLKNSQGVSGAVNAVAIRMLEERNEDKKEVEETKEEQEATTTAAAAVSLVDVGLEEEEEESDEDDEEDTATRENQEMVPLVDKSEQQEERRLHLKPEPEGRSTPKINFNSSVEIKPTLARSDYTEHEVFKSWYNKNDLQRIQQENHECIKRIQTRWGTTVRLPVSKTNQDGCDDDTVGDYCFRGLEDKTGEGYEAALTNRRNAVAIVLRYQGNRIGLERDSLRTSQVYQETVSKSRQSALEKARLDAVIAAEEDVERGINHALEHEEQVLGWLSYLPCYIF